LSPAEFHEAAQNEGVQLIDVRTASEYQQGFIEGALNMDWNGPDFGAATANLDKEKAVMVYCLGGGRSAQAATWLREHGFKKVLELDGGMMNWRSVGLPEVNETASTLGMGMQEYSQLILSNKLVLVDFYAEWCAPCKKMKPDLEALSTELGERIRIARIDVDQNKSLASELKVDALPVLNLYANGKLVWTHKGYLDKEGMLKAIEASE
jgi:thioredoxin